MFTLLLVVFFIQSAFLGAMFARMDGGGVFESAQWTQRSLVMSQIILGCIPFAGWYALAAFAGVLGIILGHGTYMPTLAPQPSSPERLDFIVRLFFGRDPRAGEEFKQWRDLPANQIPKEITAKVRAAMEAYGVSRLRRRAYFGMFVTGSITGLPAAILALYFGAYIPAALFAMTGIAKAGGYWIGWTFWRNTEAGEWTHGALRATLATAAFITGLLLTLNL